MRVKTTVKAGGIIVRDALVRAPSLKVQTSIKAGGVIIRD